MNKSWMTKLGVVAGMAACVCVASAQSNGPLGLSARIGLFLPTGTIGENLGHTWFSGGLDYKISSIPVATPTAYAGLPSYLSISADYYERDDSRDIPIALNYNIRAKQFVFSAGLGPEIDHENGGSDTVGLGGQVGAAYDLTKFPTPVFLQAKYFVSGKEAFRGFGLYAGVRF